MPILMCGHAEGEAVLPGKGRKTLMDKVTFDIHLEKCSFPGREKGGGIPDRGNTTLAF